MTEQHQGEVKPVFKGVYEANRRLVRRKIKQPLWVVWGLRLLYAGIGLFIPIMGFCLWAILRVDKKKDAIYALIPTLISAGFSLFMRFYPLVMQLIDEMRNYPQG